MRVQQGPVCQRYGLVPRRNVFREVLSRPGHGGVMAARVAAGLVAAVGIGGLVISQNPRKPVPRIVEYEEEAQGKNKVDAKIPAVCVVGGSGFVGRRVVEGLAQQKPSKRVISFDARLPPENERVPGVAYIKGTILDPTHLEKALTGRNISSVVHLANFAPTVTATEDEMTALNVEGTKNVIEACRKSAINNMVFTSSILATVERGGGDRNLNMPHDAPLTNKPFDIYACTKVEAEKLINGANGVGKMRTVILRPTAIYGPGDQSTSLKLQGKPGSYVGDGLTSWDNVSVFDVAKAHVLAVDALEKGTKDVAGHAFFVAQGQAVESRVFQGYGNNWWGPNHPQPRAVPISLINVLVPATNFIYKATGVVVLDSMQWGLVEKVTTPLSVQLGKNAIGYAPEFPTTEESVRNMTKLHGVNLKAV